MSSFLPQAVIREISQESSSTGRYLNPAKLTEETRLRFFGSGITGYEAWTEDNEPIRWEQKPEQLPANIRQQPGYTTLKRFLAAVVYDYISDDFKILQITQRTLMDLLFKYMYDEEYGDPRNYDVKISKTGAGINTKYSLVAAPPKPVQPELQARFDQLTCDLTRLYDREDPFSPPSF